MKITVQRDTRKRSDGTYAVMLCFNHDYEQYREPLGFFVKASDWDDKKRQLKLGASMGTVLNGIIRDHLDRAQELTAQNYGISALALRELFRAPVMGDMTFAELALLDLDETPPKSWHTERQRRSSVIRFDAWKPGIGVGDINSLVMERYMALLMKSVHRNTAVYQVRVLRTVYRRCCKRLGVPPGSILEDLDAVERYTEAPVQLTADEVVLLMAYEPTVSGWKGRVVAMWLFSELMGGIRWGDLCRMSTDHIQDGRLRYVANKVDGERNLLLLPEAEALTHKYRVGKMLFGIAGDQVPSMKRIASANATANKYLKVAAKACGITKRMHTHNARHTFASKAFTAGVHDRLVQAVMDVGDKSYKHYRARFPLEHVDDALIKISSKAGRSS